MSCFTQPEVVHFPSHLALNNSLTKCPHLPDRSPPLPVLTSLCTYLSVILRLCIDPYVYINIKFNENILFVHIGPLVAQSEEALEVA